MRRLAIGYMLGMIATAEIVAVTRAIRRVRRILIVGRRIRRQSLRLLVPR